MKIKIRKRYLAIGAFLLMMVLAVVYADPVTYSDPIPLTKQDWDRIQSSTAGPDPDPGLDAGFAANAWGGSDGSNGTEGLPEYGVAGTSGSNFNIQTNYTYDLPMQFRISVGENGVISFQINGDDVSTYTPGESYSGFAIGITWNGMDKSFRTDQYVRLDNIVVTRPDNSTQSLGFLQAGGFSNDFDGLYQDGAFKEITASLTIHKGGPSGRSITGPDTFIEVVGIEPGAGSQIVPEPSTPSAVALGLLGLAGWFRFRGSRHTQA